MPTEMNPEGLMNLGATIRSHLDTHIQDRRLLENQWIKNLRQYLGKYDPDVEKLIPAERSKAYPRDTRVKVKGYVAKMMEMMFPSQDSNWELGVSAIPSIARTDLDKIIQTLEIQEAAQAEAEQRPAEPVSSEDIERAVREFAIQRKTEMEKEIQDQLDDEDTNYPEIAKRVVRSGAIYGFGVVRSPMVRTQQERVWEFSPEAGRYEAKSKSEKRPYPEYVRVWDLFPDLSARRWKEQDRIFERMVLGRRDFAKLADRPDFIKSAIKEYLRTHQSGNYTERDYESDLRVLSHTTNLTAKNSRRYELFRHLGYITAHELQSAGVDVAEDDMHKDILADIWVVDNVIIKAKRAVFGERPSDHYPAFIATEDEDSGMTGVGKPEDYRDSQMAICAATRAMLDNMASVAGPIFEVNLDLLPPGRKSIGAIHSFMTIEREGDGNLANYPAVRQINTNSHIPEIQGIVDNQRQQLDMESNLPAWTFGAQPQQMGEAFRTSHNMSMLTGGANMVTKDDVRAFDIFTTDLISGFLKWNMKYSDREEIKGDFQVKAKGNLSLVAREVRGAALDQFLATLGPEDRAMFDMYGINLDRLKARDLPVDRLLPRTEAMENVRNIQQAQQKAQQIEQDLTVAKTQKQQASAGRDTAEAQVTMATADSIIAKTLSEVEQNMAKAKTAKDKAALENLKTLLEASQGTPRSE